MSNGSIRLGTFFGIPVRAHWSMALIAVLLGVNLVLVLGAIGGSIAVVAFFGSLLVHEFSHALVARRFGVETEHIDLWALGGLARLDREPPRPLADGLIAVAGPLSNGLLGALFLAVEWQIDGRWDGSSVLTWLGIVNVGLCAFNLLPGAPLDGGRIVRAVRWAMTGSRYRGMRDAGNVGRLLGWSLVAIGLAMTFNGMPGLFVALTGFFIAVNARAEVMASLLAEGLDGLKVGDLTWFGVAQVGTDMDADSMIWQRQRLGGAGAVAVVDDAGRLDGLVLEDQLDAIPPERRGLVMLTSLMAPFSSLARATPDEELVSVLPRLNPLRPIVTVWNGDALLGVVPPKRLRERLEQASRTAFGVSPNV
jgi:Zn-dependent protease